MAYPHINPLNLQTIPKGVELFRAPAFDAQRHLAIHKRYLGILALPDRWQSWIATGVLVGAKLIRCWRPAVMMSTFPIASAHAIGYCLSRLFRIPWVADFRDPMVWNDYPDDFIIRHSYRWLEGRVFQQANHITVTTQGTLKLYCERYGGDIGTRISVIENGFDETLFHNLGCAVEETIPKIGPLKILHSGLIYSRERNPSSLFHALAELRDEGHIDSDQVCFFFRASGYSEEFRRRFSHLKLDGLVNFDDNPLPYSDAIFEMKCADALVVLQGAVCNLQIPAKVYEYLAARRPVLALTDPAGDTAKLINELGNSNILRLDNKQEIKDQLPGFLTRLRTGNIPMPKWDHVLRLSRRSRSKELADLLNEIVSFP